LFVSVMTETGGKVETLAAILSQMPEPMQRHLTGLAQAILEKEQDHATRVSGLEAEAAAAIQQIEVLRVEAAALDVDVAALRKETDAMRCDVGVLRAQNAAMVAERAAYAEVIASVERYIEMKRKVDALLGVPEASGVAEDPLADGEAADVASCGTNSTFPDDTGRVAEGASAVAIVSIGRPLDSRPMTSGDAERTPCSGADPSAPGGNGSAVGHTAGAEADVMAKCPPGRRGVGS
jgi:hypothetical protein